MSDRNSFTIIHEEAFNFGFGCVGHGKFDDFGKGKDRSVEEGMIFVTEVLVSSRTAMGFGGNNIGYIIIDIEDHVTGTEFDFSIGFTGSIVEEVFGGSDSGL